MCMSACGNSDKPPVNLVPDDMGEELDMQAPVDMAPIEYDFVYTIPDIPIVDECDEDAEDLPDRFGIDLDCDGLDGEVERSVFVASYGDDANDGSRYMPVSTIARALQIAQADVTKDWVLVQEGRYEEQVELVDGVSIAGGYELGWKRDGNGFSQVLGGNPTVRGVNITTPTYIMNLEVRPTEQLASDRFSVVSMALEQSPGIILERMFIIGGTGKRGLDGARGADGVKGGDGGNGRDGKEDSGGILCSSNSKPSPGAGGASACGAEGGRGGEPEKGGSTGKPGDDGPSVQGLAGGAGGAGGSKKSNGEMASPGSEGSTGEPGAGALAAGAFIGYEWQGQTGATGTPGTPGSGGGGGGGGGGGEDGCDSWGGAGGGGGAGGCPGEGGLGGGPGGASVALMLIDSDITIRASRIVLGQGGAGGDGGGGGFGGEGGEGGEGGRREDDSGAGGAGASGGEGGTGGPGGGGSGGPAFGIYSNIMLTTSPEEMNYVEGSAGFGGSGAGAMGNGEPGVTLPIQQGSP